MIERHQIEALDIATLESWIDSDAALSELLAELPFLRSEADALRFVEDVRMVVDDVQNGRTVSHAQIARDVAERRRSYRTDAAE